MLSESTRPTTQGRSRSEISHYPPIKSKPSKDSGVVKLSKLFERSAVDRFKNLSISVKRSDRFPSRTFGNMGSVMSRTSDRKVSLFDNVALPIIAV